MDFTPQVPVAVVILDQPVSLDFQHLRSTLSSRHADVPFDVVSPADADVLMIRTGGHVITVMQVDLPVPGGWEPAAKRAAVHWQDAQAAFARHRAHLVVSALSGAEDHLASARCITAVVGALAEAYPACSGVLWDSVVAHAAATYAIGARNAFSPYPDFPSTLWISLQPFQDNAETVGVLTLGLRNFIGREIELDGPISQLKVMLERTEGLAVYLMQPGVTLRDGDTIGVSGAERITIRHTQSGRFQGLPVLAGTLVFK